MATVKMRLTVILEYETDTEYYDTDDATRMAQVDQENYQSDPNTLFEIMNDDSVDLKVTVEPV